MRSPIGWRNDHHRHYLAAKYGSAGNRYFMPVVKETGIPVVDYPGEYKSYVEKRVVKMPPRKFWQILKDSSPEANSHIDMSLDEWRKHVSGGTPEYAVREIKGLERGDDLPAPYIGFETKNGRVVREGFDNASSATAAEEAGIPEIPVVLLKAREYKQPAPGNKSIWGEFVFSPSERAKEAELIEKQGALTIDHPAPGVNVIRPENGEPYRDSDWREVLTVDTVPKEFNRKPGSKWFWENEKKEKKVEEDEK